MGRSGGSRRDRKSHLQRSAASVSRSQFEALVTQALDAIPEPFISKLENVAVVIQEQPSPELLADLGMSRNETLFGLYDGIPITERGDWYNLTSPDRIIIFRRPLLAACSTPQEIKEEVRLTVLHEVAHFYGIDDDELDRMGLS